MDSWARGLLIAERVLSDTRLSALIADRYRSFDSVAGARFERRDLDLAALRDLAASAGQPQAKSGKQELVENLINDHIVAG